MGMTSTHPLAPGACRSKRHAFSPQSSPPAEGAPGSWRGRDLRGRRLISANLKGFDLRDVDFRGADLRGADLFRARLDGADLRGAHLDTTRIVEIAVPEDLSLEIVNQIRHFDFRFAMTRFVGPNVENEPLGCPYRSSTLRPILYEWGSWTWNDGRGWTPPAVPWTLEEIIASVLDALNCRHDLQEPCRRPDRLEGLPMPPPPPRVAARVSS